MLLYEFDCADCQSHVYSWSKPPESKVCQMCRMIVEINARDPMTPEQEAKLREILHCGRERDNGTS